MPPRGLSDGMVYGAGRDLERTIRTHLFIISPNHSGSTFLSKALATSQAVWSLPGEADGIPGSMRPAPPKSPGMPRPSKFWAASQARIDRLADLGGYDWPRNRKAWYFMARARDPKAPVFVAKALFQVEMLVQSFRNARFLFVVRNPYATGEGICRVYRERNGADPSPAIWQGRGLEEWAATHLVNCFARQRRNVEAHGERRVFFPYEAMCAEPERVGREIRALVPALDDLNLRQRLPVKGRYDEMLTDMNARQIVRLGAGQVTAFNRVFHGRRDLFDYFGYELLDAGAFRPGHAPGRAIGETVPAGPSTEERPLRKSSGWCITELSGMAAVGERFRRATLRSVSESATLVPQRSIVAGSQGFEFTLKCRTFASAAPAGRGEASPGGRWSCTRTLGQRPGKPGWPGRPDGAFYVSP